MKSFDIGDKMVFIELVDKGASPVGFRKSLGIDGAVFDMHMGKLGLYRQQVETYKKIKDLMVKLKAEIDPVERKKIVTTMNELHKTFKELNKD